MKRRIQYEIENEKKKQNRNIYIQMGFSFVAKHYIRILSGMA